MCFSHPGSKCILTKCSAIDNMGLYFPVLISVSCQHLSTGLIMSHILDYCCGSISLKVHISVVSKIQPDSETNVLTQVVLAQVQYFLFPHVTVGVALPVGWLTLK